MTYALQNVAQNGDHIIAANNLYGGTFNLLEHTLSTQGVTTTIVDPANFDEVDAAFRPNTKAVIIETFGNPHRLSRNQFNGSKNCLRDKTTFLLRQTLNPSQNP